MIGSEQNSESKNKQKTQRQVMKKAIGCKLCRDNGVLEVVQVYQAHLFCSFLLRCIVQKKLVWWLIPLVLYSGCVEHMRGRRRTCAKNTTRQRGRGGREGRFENSKTTGRHPWGVSPVELEIKMFGIQYRSTPTDQNQCHILRIASPSFDIGCESWANSSVSSEMEHHCCYFVKHLKYIGDTLVRQRRRRIGVSGNVGGIVRGADLF